MNRPPFPVRGELTYRLQAGTLGDAEFDALYPSEVAAISSKFWTPIEVAMRAAELLGGADGRKILDIGAGVGKFCLVGAAGVGGTYVGIEQRPRLVQIAREAAQTLKLRSVEFREGDLSSVDLREFDGIYLFNPFEENVRGPKDHIDETVPLSIDRYLEDVAATEALLEQAAPGTHVAIYHGFGGRRPADYVKVVEERWRYGRLELWKKQQ